VGADLGMVVAMVERNPMKRFIAAALSAIAAVATLAIAPEAGATNYSLYICGRNCNGTPGTYTNFSYWGSSATAAGVNKKAVNWDGYSAISTTNSAVRDALDCYCTGNNFCYVAVHSAGDLQLGYALAQYGGGARYKKNATPNASGVCGNTDGTTQTGWNIKWVDVASGAGGGSELANMGDWTTSSPLVNDLKTGNARALYDHNQTRSKAFYMFAGASGTAYSMTLPGQDDEAIAYHSSMGAAATGSLNNWSDWTGTYFARTNTANASWVEWYSSSTTLWTNRYEQFIDQGESYNHYTNGAWGGISSPVRADMAANAL